MIARVLQWFGIAERRCAWCGLLLGWRRGKHVSHGICPPCADGFENS